MTPDKKHWQAELGLAAIALIWGATFVMIKQALADISPVLFLAIRFAAAGAILFAIYVARKGLRGVRRSPWTGGILLGAFLFAGYLFQTVGLRYTTASKSGFITGLYIPMVPLISAVVFRAAPRVMEIVGVAVATAGMALMTLDPGTFTISYGDALTVGCALSFAVHISLLGHLSRRMDAGWLAALQVIMAGAAAVLSAPFLEHSFVRWSPAVLVALLITSVFATALAFLVQTWGQQHTTTTRAAIIFSLEPVFALLTGWLYGGERLDWRALSGAGLILAGILIVELKPAPGNSSHSAKRPEPRTSL